MTLHLWQKVKKMKVKEESENAGLKLTIQMTKIMTKMMASWCHHFRANRWEAMETVTDFVLGAPKSLQMVTAAMKLKDTYSLEEKLSPTLASHIKKQRHYFADKGPSSQSYGFSSSHVWM